MRRGPGIGDLTLIFRYEKNYFIYSDDVHFLPHHLSIKYFFTLSGGYIEVKLCSFYNFTVLVYILNFFADKDDIKSRLFSDEPFLPFQGVLELEPDTSLIEERVRGRVKGVLPCDLSTEEVFPEGVNFAPVEVLICSLGDTFFANYSALFSPFFANCSAPFFTLKVDSDSITTFFKRQKWFTTFSLSC
jgi:hypothetical protein